MMLTHSEDDHSSRVHISIIIFIIYLLNTLCILCTILNKITFYTYEIHPHLRLLLALIIITTTTHHVFERSYNIMHFVKFVFRSFHNS